MRKSMPPFRKIKTQKIFSIVILLIGLLLMFFTIPFIIKFGFMVILGSAIGLILFLLGLIYFLSAMID